MPKDDTDFAYEEVAREERKERNRLEYEVWLKKFNADIARRDRNRKRRAAYAKTAETKRYEASRLRCDCFLLSCDECFQRETLLGIRKGRPTGRTD